MQPTQEPYIPAPPEHAAEIHRSNKLKLVWGLICLIAPTALVVISILAYAVANFVFSSVDSASNPLYAPSPNQAANILLFLIGGFSVLTWLPGIIVGIILLATRKRV